MAICIYCTKKQAFLAPFFDFGPNFHAVRVELKPASQCAKAAKKAHLILGQMTRAFTYRDKWSWIKLYKMYVRHHLEYAIQAWCPWTEADIEVLEAVQRRAVRMVSGLKSNVYEERLKEIGLPSLVDRRRRGDMIEVWKILHGEVNVDPSIWFTMASEAAERCTRQSSSPLAIKPPPWKGDIRRHFFSVRVVNDWNSLPLAVQDAHSINAFKNSYDNLHAS